MAFESAQQRSLCRLWPITWLLFLLPLGLYAEETVEPGSNSDTVIVEPTTAQPKTDEPPPVAKAPVIEPVYEKVVKGDFKKIYQQLFTSLENNGYFVVFEPNIGKQLARFKQRWGAKYNKNQLDAIRSMVFCNAWYANEVSNNDPKVLALCPMHLTLYQKEGRAHILFTRPSVIATGSRAEKLALEIEQDVIRVIEEGASR